MKDSKTKPPKADIDNVYTMSYNENSRQHYEWDPNKNRKNFKQHSIWFDEAQTIWADPQAVEYFDEEHSEDEDRYIRIGRTTRSKVLLVVYCEREDGGVIRLISARKATPKERRDYEKGI